MSCSVHELPDQTLLAMLLGRDVAVQLQGQSLGEIFGLTSDSNTVQESESAYLARPVIHAARELLSRALEQGMRHRNALTSPDAMKKFLHLLIGHLEHEVFVIVCLDAQNRLITSHELFRGTLTQASVYPREVIKFALQHNAAAVAFAHNHPSGVACASEADKRLTATLKTALALVDIRVLDHFIVGETLYSFAEHGLM